MRSQLAIWSAVLLAAAFVFQTSGSLAAGSAATDILDATGVKGGLIVHLGCGDGHLTAGLRANEGFLVHGLEADPAQVENARRFLQSRGSYGKISVECFSGRQLPYIDNLVNLLVAEDLGQVALEEVMRVLVPQGVAYVKSGGRWTKTVKPRPKEYDEWTHYLHDASGNAVAQDTAIAPLRHMQWIAGPRYSRHHDHMSGASAMVSAGGRLFYIFDHASAQAIQLPSDWKLVARDAFNGAVLWTRPIAQWHTQMFKLKSGPAQLTRRLVAVGDRVYVTLGLEAPVSQLDATTGQTLRAYSGTEKTEEIIADGGTLFLLINDEPAGQPRESGQLSYTYVEGPRRIVAMDAQSGKILWNQPQADVLPCTLVADGRRVLFADAKRVVCLDRRSGTRLWQSAPVQRRKLIPTFFAPSLVIYQDVVFFSGGSTEPKEKNAGGGDNTMYAFAADSGKTLWTGDHPASGYKSPEDILVLDGLVWTAETTFGQLSGEMVGRDPHSGEVRKRFRPDVDTHWFHHRCYRAKATEKYILTSRTGIEFVDPQTEHWECHHWARGACLYGIMPANGMIYNPPHPCACYLESKLYGFNALAPTSATRAVPRQVPAEGRLEKGSAYAATAAIAGPKVSGSSEGDWPTFRRDAARSGFTPQAVPARLQPAWEARLEGRLSAPVIADGKLLVASIDAHTLHALDAATGRSSWSFTAGGRIDSPPTVWQGRALFGSADGYVYCLRASDGALAWRFRAAPVDRRMGAFDQIESVWPVHGAVLLRDGELWCVAGRSMFLDGGLRLLRLDPATGRLIAEQVLDDRDPESGKNLQVRLKQLNMPVAMADVLVYDGKYVYMKSQQFDREGNRVDLDVPTLTPQQQHGETAHLFCPTGLLDDVWWHRSYWVYGRVWKSGAGGYYMAGRAAPAGRPMVFDNQKVYGYARTPNYYRWTTPMEYQLFASAKQPGLTRAGNPEGKAGKKAVAKKSGDNMSARPDAGIALDWKVGMPVLVRAMVLADKTLFLAGPPDVVNEEESLKTFATPETQQQLARQAAAIEGVEGGILQAVSTTNGSKLAEYRLKSVPVFDGMAAAGGKLFVVTLDGKVQCLAARR